MSTSLAYFFRSPDVRHKDSMERQTRLNISKIALHKIRIGPQLHKVPPSVSGFNEKRRGWYHGGSGSSAQFRIYW